MFLGAALCDLNPDMQKSRFRREMVMTYRTITFALCVFAVLWLRLQIIDTFGLGRSLAQDGRSQEQENKAFPSENQRNRMDNAERTDGKTKFRHPATVSFDVTGKIENPDGSAAAEATVIAIRLRPGLGPESRRQVTADERGEFSMRLTGVAKSNAEWWMLALHGDDSGRQSVSFIFPSRAEDGTKPLEQQPESILIRMVPGRVISGTVFDEVTRNPIPFARVYSHQGQLVRTNRDGRFELRGVPAGIETLVITGRSSSVRTRVFVDVSERNHAEIDLFLAPGGTVQGRVLDQNGDPVPGAAVSRSSGSMILSAALTETTDDEGRFTFDGFPLKTLMYPLQVSVPGFYATESNMFAIRDFDQPLELTLGVAAAEENGGPAGLRNALAGGAQVPPVGAIRGRVFDPQGRPVRNFIVKLLAVTSNEARDSGSFSASTRHFCDDDGRFVIGQLDENKRYRIAAMAPGFGCVVIEPIFARRGSALMEQDAIEFRLGPPHQLQLQVVDAETRQAIPDVMIGFLENSGRRGPFEWNYRLNGAHVEWTSTTGTACFTDLSTDEGSVFIEHPGYARHQQFWRQAVKSPAGMDEGRIEIVLVKESRLKIRIANLGKRDVRGLYATVTTLTGQTLDSPMGVPGDPPTITLRQLSPGKQTLVIYDASAAQPWIPLATFEANLKQGDNETEIDLSRDLK